MPGAPAAIASRSASSAGSFNASPTAATEPGAATPFEMFFTRFSSDATPSSASEPASCDSASSLRRTSSGLSAVRRRRASRPAPRGRRSPRCSSRYASRSDRTRSSGAAASPRPPNGSAALATQRARSVMPSVESSELGQVGENLDRALRLPPQPERIARPGRPLAADIHAHDRIELVGQRHGRPGDRRRARAAPSTAAHRLPRRSAGSGSRSPSTPARAVRPRARRCRPWCPGARSARAPCRWRGPPCTAGPPARRARRPPAAAATSPAIHFASAATRSAFSR